MKKKFITIGAIALAASGFAVNAYVNNNSNVLTSEMIQTISQEAMERCNTVKVSLDDFVAINEGKFSQETFEKLVEAHKNRIERQEDRMLSIQKTTGELDAALESGESISLDTEAVKNNIAKLKNQCQPQPLSYRKITSLPG